MDIYSPYRTPKTKDGKRPDRDREEKVKRGGREKTYRSAIIVHIRRVSAAVRARVHFSGIQLVHPQAWRGPLGIPRRVIGMCGWRGCARRVMEGGERTGDYATIQHDFVGGAYMSSLLFTWPQTEGT